MEILLVFLICIIIIMQTVTLFKTREKKRIARGSILLDTSAIMDGRIIDVAETGILTAELIIPRSVIREMQLLADKADNEKRARARNGLENIKKLQSLESVAIIIVNDGFAHDGVDERLLDLANKYNASIATVDYNLNKVAKTMDILVINVNELAQKLRMQYLPGEQIKIKVTGTGQNRQQGVGHLEDGTMVVIENGKELIGREVHAVVSRALQTEAGRMIFATTDNRNAIKPKTPIKKIVEEARETSPKKPAKKPHKPYYKKKRQTPEDSLIDLANK